MTLVRKRNIVFFKNDTFFPYGPFLAKDYKNPEIVLSFLMKNEGTSGQTKRTEFTRPLSLWESKIKNNPQSLILCHGQTSGLTELNS